MRRWFCAGIVAGLLLAGAGTASAHPHVLVSVRTTTVINDQGEVEALKHAWKFDDAFSTFSTQGLDKNGDGKFDREELADLAKVNVESLSEYGYFSFIRRGKDQAEFGSVKDYWLSHDGKNLTLHFTLPLAGKPFRIQDIRLEVYDPTFFVAFDFEKDNPVTVEGGKLACTTNIAPPKTGVTERLSKLGESFFQSMNAGANADWAVPVRFTCQ
ncbi:MAG TPA: DUF1007 family protein [Rhabdaerophilum sp.]|nr:DUF1007 family protein [Rhabdaerophilum sp.]